MEAASRRPSVLDLPASHCVLVDVRARLAPALFTQRWRRCKAGGPDTKWIHLLGMKCGCSGRSSQPIFFIVPNVETMGCNHQFIISFHVHITVVLIPSASRPIVIWHASLFKQQMYCPCSFPSSETRKMVLRGRAILEPEALGWGCWESDCIIPMIASCAWQARYRIERFITMTSIHYVLVRETKEAFVDKYSRPTTLNLWQVFFGVEKSVEPDNCSWCILGNNKVTIVYIWWWCELQVNVRTDFSRLQFHLFSFDDLLMVLLRLVLVPPWRSNQLQVDGIGGWDLPTSTSKLRQLGPAQRYLGGSANSFDSM